MTEITTKAQRIRKECLKIINNNSLIAEAEKVFDWILDEFDKNNKNNQYFNVCVFERNGYIDMFGGGKYEKSLKEILKGKQTDNIYFFEVLRYVIEREEGFKVRIIRGTELQFWLQIRVN